MLAGGARMVWSGFPKSFQVLNVFEPCVVATPMVCEVPLPPQAEAHWFTTGAFWGLARGLIPASTLTCRGGTVVTVICGLIVGHTSTNPTESLVKVPCSVPYRPIPVMPSRGPLNSRPSEPKRPLCPKNKLYVLAPNGPAYPPAWALLVPIGSKMSAPTTV